MPGTRNLPWELTNSRQESSVSPLDLRPHMPADLTFICSPFVLCHGSPDQVPGFQNLRRAAVGSLCLFTGCRDNCFCTSPPLCGTVCTAWCISNNTN